MTKSDNNKSPKSRKNKSVLKIVLPVIAVFVILIIGIIVALVMSESSSGVKKRKQIVTLLPPPPPKKIEQEPEPEIKKEEIVEPEPEPEPDDSDDAPEDEAQSVDDLLGLDSDATGSDSFGLKAKKGGRSILGGGDGRFRWYTSIFQKKISDLVRELLQKDGGLPDGTLKVYVRVTINDDGQIDSFKLIKPSGNERVDEAVYSALSSAEFDEIPPLEMPRVMKFRVTSTGQS